MTIREIITIGHPTLRQKARKVTKFGPEVKQLIDDMIETMREAPGVGVAAPEVNVSERIIVVEVPADEEEGIPAELYAYVNPEIVKTSREIEDEEGAPLDPRLCRRGRPPHLDRGARAACLRQAAAHPRRTTTWRGFSSMK